MWTRKKTFSALLCRDIKMPIFFVNIMVREHCGKSIGVSFTYFFCKLITVLILWHIVIIKAEHPKHCKRKKKQKSADIFGINVAVPILWSAAVQLENSEVPPMTQIIWSVSEINWLTVLIDVYGKIAVK